MNDVVSNNILEISLILLYFRREPIRILQKILSRDRYPVVRERIKNFQLSSLHSSKVERAKSALPGRRCLFARLRVFSIPKRYSDVRVGTRWELQVISSVISRVCNPSHVLDNPISQGELFRLCDRSRFAFTGKLKTKIAQTGTKGEVDRDAHFRNSAFVSVKHRDSAKVSYASNTRFIVAEIAFLDVRSARNILYVIGNYIYNCSSQNIDK